MYLTLSFQCTGRIKDNNRLEVTFNNNKTLLDSDGKK